jgi:hypothetical protein
MDSETTTCDVQSPRSSKWFRLGFLLAAAMGCAVAISPSPADPDLWGHVRYGRDVLETGELATTTTYSYTAEGFRWINHENLMELALALGADSLGSQGMLIAKCALGMFVIALMSWFAYRGGVSLVTVCVISLLVSVNLAHHWAMRPQLATYAFYALMLALLQWCFAGWQGKWQLPIGRLRRRDAVPSEIEYSSYRLRFLWLMPILFLLWANSHGGFIAGFCIYAAYLGLRSLEVLCSHGRRGLGLLRRFALMVIVAGLATFVNPYGPNLHFWLVESLGIPRPEITEWAAANMFSQGAIPLWTLIVLTIGSLVLSHRSRDFTYIVILALTLWQSLIHARHIPFFAIAVGFWLPPYVSDLFKQFSIGKQEKEVSQQSSPVWRGALAVGLCLAICLLGYRLHDRLSVLQVKKSKYPVAAFQYIADHELNGRMVVTFNWAQYSIAAFGPTSPDEQGILVSVDGRFRTCYPQEVLDMNFDLVLGDQGPTGRFRSPNSPSFDSKRILEFRKPDLALICRGQPHSQRVMERNTNTWVLLYQDSLAQLWGRRTKYADPLSPEFIAPSQRNVGNQRQEGIVDWPAMPVRDHSSKRVVTRDKITTGDHES